MLIEKKNKKFANGIVYALSTEDGYPIEVTDTFLPTYTKDAIGRKQNKLDNYNLGSRKERWMIGVSCMSGCPCHCAFCATGQLPKWRNLTAEEIVEQVEFILNKNPEYNPEDSFEFKVNFTRMGEYSFNKENIRKAIDILLKKFPNVHIFISTIGIKGDTFEWVKDNITLQISAHSLKEEYRDSIIPMKNKMFLKELGQIRTNSNLKTTVNLTLTNDEVLDVNKLKEYFDPQYFFIKLSPLNENVVSNKNGLKGVIKEGNYL
jgi:23S rRNA (adenine2503-C2)-methyltransferase